MVNLNEKPIYHQTGTAFLITYKHIITAAHTLFYKTDNPSKK